MVASSRARRAGRCATCAGCKNSSSIIPLIRSRCRRWSKQFALSKERVERLEQTIEEFVPNWSLAPVVRALQALRGIDLIIAVTFATEIGDVRRFESPRQLMGYLGLVPSERSTGDDGSARRHHQGRERTCPPHAGRERLDLSPSAHGSATTKLYRLAAGHPAGARDRLEGADPSDGSLSSAELRAARRQRWSAQQLHVSWSASCGRSPMRRRPPEPIAQVAAFISRMRRGRDHGRGMPVRRFVAGLRADARCKIGTAPDAHSGMR